MRDRLVLAYCETSNFTFTCTGVSIEQAVDGLIRGLRKHARQHNLGPKWAMEQDRKVEIHVPGLAMRDGLNF